MKIDVSLLEKLDEQIKCGDGDKVKAVIQNLRSSSVSRKHCADLARIALRVWEPRFAYLCLKNIIDTEKPVHPPATDDELTQFGMCLKQFGATDHALKIFSRVSASNHPDVLLYEAITLFTQWRYLEAIPKLQKYIVQESITDYQKQIGKLNLASAFVFESRYEEASELLDALLSMSRKNKQYLLQANALELQAQVKIMQMKMDDAETLLAKAQELIPLAPSNYRLFIEKWTAVVQLKKSGGDLSSLQNLNWVREKAISIGHFETVRDCDYFFATVKKDDHLFHRLYFGTPFQPYRDRLVRVYNTPSPLPRFFDWRGNTAHQPVVGHLDMLDLNKDDNDQNFRLIKALSRDFYSPIKPYPLFMQLYPKEKLDPNETSARMYKAVSRAKKWFKQLNAPISIEVSEMGYRLHWSGPFVIRVPNEVSLDSKDDLALAKLKAHFSGRSFTTLDAAEHLNYPRRSLMRMLSVAVSNQDIHTIGKGRSTRYAFKK